MEGFEAYLQAKGLSKASIQSYGYAVNQFQSWAANERQVVAEAATTKDILAYLAYLKNQNLKRKTINEKLLILKHFFACHQVAKNPILHIRYQAPPKQKQLYKLLTKAELLGACQLIGEEGWPLHHQNMAMLLLLQGLEARELVTLQVAHINLRKSTITLPAGRKLAERTHLLAPVQVLPLLEQLNDRKSIGSDYLFTFPANHPQNHMKAVLKRLRKLYPAMTSWRQVRASLINHWIAEHGLRKAQQLAGHRQISTTETYQANNDEALRVSLQNLHPLG